MNRWGYSDTELKIFRRLKSPARIQDFLRTIKYNPAMDGVECRSPRRVLRERKAHCMEGALLAAAILEFQGQQPLLMDLRSTKHDLDHVVALFKHRGCWGAISKTNHVVLRYREPVYRSLRELAMSYFHEYFLDDGRKTLREYSRAFNVTYLDRHPLTPDPSPARGEGKSAFNWRTSEEDLWELPQELDKIKHYKILSSPQIKRLRKAEQIEIRAGKLVEWK